MNIKEIEEHYTIYYNGLVRNLKMQKWQAHNICKNGYHRVHLTVNGKRKAYSVHRLVAKKFIKGETESKCEVNHKDGDKGNNREDNLEWCTRKENMHHAKYKLKREMGAIEDEIRNEMIAHLRMNYSRNDVARLLKTTPENITLRCKQHNKKCV